MKKNRLTLSFGIASLLWHAKALFSIPQGVVFVLVRTPYLVRR